MIQVIRNLAAVRSLPRNYIVTIGNFDGVHRGHQYLLQQLLAHAKATALRPLVIIFEPQPLEFLAPEQAPVRLTNFREKIYFLQQAGVQQVLCLPFTKTLAQLTAPEFVKQILVDGLAIKQILVGDDFRFGYQRAGDKTLLSDLGKVYQFSVDDLDTLQLAGQRVSSTEVRAALAAGQLALAEQLLGRPYSICGKVVSGAQRGRTMGVPTANLALAGRQPALRGVFAVTVRDNNNRLYQGVANLGDRPTVDGQNCYLETHIFDFDQVLYGQRIQVQFHHKLRAEQRFASLSELLQQIQQDIKQAKEYFADRQ